MDLDKLNELYGENNSELKKLIKNMLKNINHLY